LEGGIGKLLRMGFVVRFLLVDLGAQLPWLTSRWHLVVMEDARWKRAVVLVVILWFLVGLALVVSLREALGFRYSDLPSSRV
jgi:hypothetical protein